MILLLDSGHAPGENMRRDRALLARLDASQGADDPRALPVLRLFRFDAHSITLGHAQEPSATLDLAACERDHVPWAVRPTGGRAVFHADEWTYSFAARIDDTLWGGSLQRSYDTLASWLCDALCALGVPAQTAARTGADRRPHGGGAPRDACFTSTSRHEIVLSGRKLVGSAQRRTRTALLQQGSLLLGPGHERLADYVLAAPADRERLRRALGGAAHAGPHLGPRQDPGLWADSLAATAPHRVRRVSNPDEAAELTGFETDSYTRPVASNDGS